MTLENIYYIGQTIAVAAIFGSVIFVGFQIRENSAAVRSTTARAVHDNYGAWYMAQGADAEALDASIKGFVDYEGLAPIERRVLSAPTWRFLLTRKTPSINGRRAISRLTCGRDGRR